MSTPSRPGLRAFLALSLLGVAQFAWWRPTNFAGIDEWLILSLNSRGVVSFPHANRPLHLLWGLPGFALTPYRFEGYFAVHVLYLLGSAWLTWWLVSRLAPRPRALAFLAAAFALTWAPLDMARLASPQMVANAGATCAALAALALLLEGWRRDRVGLLVLAVGVAFLAVRSYEAALAPLLAGPLLLRATPDASTTGSTASRTRWSLAWLIATALLTALVVGPLLARSREAAYQGDVHRPDFDPVHWAERMGRLYVLHLEPLLPRDASLIVNVGAGLAAVALVIGVVLALGRQGLEEDSGGRRRLGWLAAGGLLFAGLGYAPFALSASITTATRTQFFAAPGIGLFLAASLLLAISRTPPAWRRLLLMAPAAFVVACGVGYGIGMQREWDRISYYTAQRSALRSIASELPALRPNTLLVLIDDDATFPYSLTFRHAAAVLYGEAVVGHVVNANAFLYDASVHGSELRIDPWPVIARPWHERPSRHRFDEAVALRLAGGRVSVLERWEDPLLPLLPPGARYDPRARIVDGPIPQGRRALE